jgi:purine-binding chemotaxis protein CheW
MGNPSAHVSSSRQFVVFHVCNEEYALPIDQIQEVIRYTQPRSVVSEDPCVIGVISLRGKVVPVSDLARRLGVSATPSEDSKIVIIETEGETLGMIVDAVDEVVSIDDDQLDATTVADRRIVRGIAKLDQRLVVVLEPQAFGGSTEALAA